MNGETVTALIDEVFRLNGRLLRAGDALTAGVGLTSARWQVLGALGDGPATVAQIARLRGLRRQSVQEVVARLATEHLVVTRPNPRDRRAPLVHLTPRASALLETLRPVQADWATQLGTNLTAEDLACAVKVLAALNAALAAES